MERRNVGSRYGGSAYRERVERHRRQRQRSRREDDYRTFQARWKHYYPMGSLSRYVELDPIVFGVGIRSILCP